MWPGGSAQNPPHPALRRVLADEFNHLWIQEYTLPGQGGGNPVRTVFDPEGHVLAARGQNPPGIQAAMHPVRTLRPTFPQRKDNFTLCYVWYTLGVPKAALCVAPQPNSAAIGPSSRLAGPAPRRSRCSRGFIHGLLGFMETPTGLRVYQIGEDYILCYGGAVSGPSVTTAPAPNPLPFHT